MADKEYRLGNKAADLLKYTNQATKVVTDDVSLKDVRAILHRIAQMENINDARAFCERSLAYLNSKDKEGFTKATYRCYGEDMRLIAKHLVRTIHAANDKRFETEYEERLRLINVALDDCALLLEYIRICMEMNIVGTKKGGIWSEQVSEVRYMLLSWKKKDTERAQTLRNRKAEAERQKRADFAKLIADSVYKAAHDALTGK